MKKYITLILTFLIYSNLSINAFAFYPNTLDKNETSVNSSTLQFQDDFSVDMQKWESSNFKIEANKAVNENWGELKTGFDNFKFCNATVIVNFKITSRKAGGFTMLKFRDGGKTPFKLLIRDNALNYISDSNGWEKNACNYEFKVNEDYEFKIDLKDDTATINLKVGNEQKYTNMAQIIGIEKAKGGLSFSLYENSVAISKVQIYNSDFSSLKFSDKAPIVDFGKEKSLSLKNQTGRNLKWSSSDEKIAVVDENGNVKGISKGIAEITVKTEDEKFEDKCSVIVIARMTAIAFHKNEMNLYVGENEELFINYEPYNVSNTQFDWEISKDGIVELMGKTDREKAVMAKAEGKVTIKATSKDTGISCECSINVTQKPQVQTKSAELVLDGSYYEIPPYIFGMHTGNSMYAVAGGFSVTKENLSLADEAELEHIKEIKSQTVRSIWQDWNPIKGQSLYPERNNANSPIYNMENLYKVPNALNIPQVVCLSMKISVDEQIAQIKEIKKNQPTQPLFVEYGNETYAIAYVDCVPTIEDYIEKLKEFSKRAKEIDQNIKIAVPTLGYPMTKSIQNDPSNFPTSELDWAYTQGIRANTWDSTLSENSQYFDAIVAHLYSGTKTLHTKEKELMKQWAKSWMYANKGLDYYIDTMFKDKEVWVTEYGALNDFFWDAPIADNRDRMQHMKSVGAAISYVGELMRIIDSQKATITNYHCLEDKQGFGLVQDGIKLPPFYSFEKIGAILDENSYYYGVFDQNVNYEIWDENLNGEVKEVIVPDIEAWGVGNEESVKQLIFLNSSENPTQVSVKDAKIKPIWVYGNEHPFPDFLVNKANSWYDAPKDIPVPKILKEKQSDVITLEPFSLTIADITVTNNSNMDKNLKNKLDNSVIVKVNENLGYTKGTKRNYLDKLDKTITPITKDGKVFVPLRFVGDAFSADFDYVPETQEVEIKYGKARIKIKEGAKAITIDKTEKTIDFSPFSINGRLYVTAEFIEEIFDKSISYIDNSLVVFSDEKEELSSTEIKKILREFER